MSEEKEQIGLQLRMFMLLRDASKLLHYAHPRHSPMSNDLLEDLEQWWIRYQVLVDMLREESSHDPS